MCDQSDRQKKRATSRRWLLREGLGSALLSVVGVRASWARRKPTEPNILGPYYRRGAPSRTRLADPSEPGERLVIRGQVLNTDEEPLKGALVDVWQANAVGRYDNDDPGKLPGPDQFLLRGQIRTDAEGRYEFETIIPGRYAVGKGQYRPAHIHYIVDSPGYLPLTTQLYFTGDPYLKTDAFVRPSLVIDLKQHPADTRFPKGHHSGEFDIVLARPGEPAGG